MNRFYLAALDIAEAKLFRDPVPTALLSPRLAGEHRILAETINAYLWDERRGFYFDRLGDRLLSRMHIGSFWSLISETASPERAERMVRLLDDPETFGLPYGVPSLAKK